MVTSRMITLFLNIASHQGCLVLVQDGECVVQHFDHAPRDHELVPAVETLLSDQGAQYSDLERIACVTGPGGFTSLRIAVSFTNTLMDQLDIPGADVLLSDLLLQRSPDAHYWLHATKRDQVFMRVRDVSGVVETPSRCVSTEIDLCSIDDLLARIPQDSSWCGELLEEQKEALASLNLRCVAMQDEASVLPSFLETLTYEKNPLATWYGREG